MKNIVMDNVIFYFSGTGNSLKVARNLAKRLQNCKVIPIKRIKEIINIDFVDTIGIVFPIYFGALPAIVAKFMRTYNFPKHNYFFAVATYRDLALSALNISSKILKNRGLKLHASFKIKMVGNYIKLYAPFPEKIQKKRLAKAEKSTGKIIIQIKKKKYKSAPIFGSFTTFLQKHNDTQLTTKDVDFWADSKCDSCEICKRVCPTHNIELYNGKPRWFHKCESCLACLQWCPKKAIQIAHKTKNRARYHHPAININDIIDKLEF